LGPSRRPGTPVLGIAGEPQECVPVSILVAILFGNVVLWNFARMYFGLIGIECVFHAADSCSFASLTFF
jgi:hypothetical protein